MLFTCTCISATVRRSLSAKRECVDGRPTSTVDLGDESNRFCIGFVPTMYFETQDSAPETAINSCIKSAGSGQKGERRLQTGFHYFLIQTRARNDKQGEGMVQRGF